MKRFFKSIFAFLLAVFFSLPAFSGFKADAEVWINWTSWDHMKELGTFATREKACEAFGPYMLRKGFSPEWSVSTSNNEAEKFCEVTAVHVNSTVNFYKMDYAYFYNCPSGTVKSGAWCYCPDDKAEFGRACLAPPVVSANENMCRAEGKIFGNPVLPASAEKFRSETDWKGEGPFAIDFVRTYRSKVDLNHARSQSVLGPGWTHNHDIRLVALGNDDDQTVLISSSHEQMDAFRSTDKGVTWTSFAGAASLSRSSGGGWTYLPALDDAVWSFDGDGRLQSRKLLNGWEMVYAYDSQGLLQSVRNSFGAEIVLQYDAQARLKKISPPDGGALRYEYDSDGRLISVSYPDGASRGFLYEVPGENYLLTGIVGEDGNRLGYFNFDADGRVISSELAGGVERYSVAYPYQSYARVKDPLGTERTYTYSMKAAQLVVNSATMPSADGRSSVNGRNQDDSGLIEMERDFRGFIKHWAWDTSRRLPLKITEAAGSAEQRTTTTLWHPQWRLPAKVTRAGSEASYGYDGAGNLLSLVLKDTTVAPARSRTWNWSYHPSGLVATQTQPNGAITRFNYDGRGNLTQSTNALNQTETYTHDSAGRVLTHLSATGVASSFQYDARGRLVRMQWGGHVSLYSYSPAGQLATASTPQGRTLTYRYDRAHRLIGWSDNRGVGASYTLDGMGNRVLEQIVDPQGKAAWQLARSINSINRVERVTFGGVDGGEVPSTIQYGYDANGDLAYTTQTANGVSANTVLDLDPLRRVKTITNAHNASATLFYDTQDAVTWASDFKNVVSEYARDALGNATQETTPDAGNSTATYDALGLIATAKDAAGRTFAVQRDALGRPTQLQYGTSATSTLRYDLPGTTYNDPGAPKASTGHLSEIQDPGVTTQYQRDILGRLLRKSQILPNGDTKAVVHTYVPAGQGGAGELQSITYPSGKQATYLYDSTGQITGLQWNGQPLVTGLAWSPLGQPTAWQWQGFAQQPGATAALAEQRSYNTAGQLASSQLLNLTWDAAGRISLIQQQHMLPGTAAAQQAKLSSAFSYDAVGRLTASAHSAPAGLTLPTGWSLADTIELSASGYAWDANGNRTQVHYSNALASGTSTLQRNYQIATGTNRLQGYAQTLQRPGSAAQNSNVTFSYDAAGALVKKGDNHLHYGADGRIAKAGEYADAADARAVSYVYNALGQRVLKSDARGAGQPATLQTLYAEDGIGSTVLGQYANQRSANSAAPAGQNDSTEIIYLPTASGPMPIAAEINGRLYAIHTDHLNTPRRLTNQQGQVAWQWLISGFGEVRPTTGDRGYGQTVSGPSYAQAVKFDLRYPGQVFDEETGLSYNLHRYYDAATGRYMQADPIGLAGGWNRFGYVGGDPLNAIDPDGLNAVVALNRIAELGRGLYYRYGPAITEFIAGASGVNGAVASPAAISPLVAQIPTTVSRMAPIAQAINQGIDTGAYCSAKSIDELVIQFGKVENQISHTFRHVERAGFNRQLVQDAIREDILRTADSLIDGQYSGSVLLNGARLDYSAFKLPNGIINVGRITPPR